MSKQTAARSRTSGQRATTPKAKKTNGGKAAKRLAKARAPRVLSEAQQKVAQARAEERRRVAMEKQIAREIAAEERRHLAAERAAERKAARDAARAERAVQARARAAEKKKTKKAAYNAAVAAMANGGEDATNAAALVLKTKGSLVRDRKRAASIMGIVGGSIGGRNRAAKLSPEQRTEIARCAGLARQAKARAERELLSGQKPSDGRARSK